MAIHGDIDDDELSAPHGVGLYGAPSFGICTGPLLLDGYDQTSIMELEEIIWRQLVMDGFETNELR
jgi:hypothetical protein